jgi:transposase-like protein
VEYAGKAICPRCEARLVHEFKGYEENASPEARAQADQMLVCSKCGYSRHVAYVVPRSGMGVKQVFRQLRHG